MYYERVFKALEEQKIRYAVVGGVALVLHGVVRFTADLDLIVELEQENLTRFLRLMQDLGYQPRNPVDAQDLIDPKSRASWKREKGMVVFSFATQQPSMELVNVFIEEAIPFSEVQRGPEGTVHGYGQRDIDPGRVDQAVKETEESGKQAPGPCGPCGTGIPGTRRDTAMNEKKGQPFVHRPSPEALDHFKNASAEAKLKWLEEAAQFVRDFVPREKIEKWMKLSRR